MMRIYDIPNQLRSPGHRYPAHNTSNGLEGFFDEYASQHANELDTDWIYLPVRWTNNYVRSRQSRRDSDLAACPQHQEILSRLSPLKRYFTIVQCDDGIYEDVPNNVLVFGAGGVGDIPIPLLCTPHSRASGGIRPWLATFIGKPECGGPKKTAVKAKRSSYDPNASGMEIRREMVQRFSCADDCLIMLGCHGTDYFVQEMSRSVFALAPRGYGRTSFRLYEAMELGCIPVYLYDEPWLPYTEIIDWSSISVLCDQSEISELPERLRGITDEWRIRALSILDGLYEEYFTLEGMCRQIFRMIKDKT